MKYFLGQLHHALHLGGTTGEYNARRQSCLHIRFGEALPAQGETVRHNVVPPLRPGPGATIPRRPITDTGHLDLFRRTGQLSQGAGILDFDVFRMLGGCTQCHRNVVGNLVTGNRE